MHFQVLKIINFKKEKVHKIIQKLIQKKFKKVIKNTIFLTNN